MLYQIWVEGFHIQGNQPTKASLEGAIEADSFQEACDKFYKARNSTLYDSKTLTLWGCKLYDNERAARRFNG